MSARTHSDVEIIEDCIQRVDGMIATVRRLLTEAPANQAIGLREETNLQRRQLGLEPLK
jgi:hypothetical protein